MGIYKRIKENWANDKNGFGNIVYLETGTGKTYIAIMLLKYMFSDKYVDYQLRLSQTPTDDPNGLQKMEIPEESEEDVKMWPSSDDVIKEIKDKRAMQVEDWLETNTLETELKKQKKVVFITPT